MYSAQELIELLRLVPLPREGGYYRETYRSAVPVPFAGGARSAGTAIYYLLTADTFSALHRLPIDEIYHFYLGAPVEVLLLGPEGGRVVSLGPDLRAGQVPQFVVPAGCWQGSCLAAGGDCALLGTTVAPSFEFSDFEAGERGRLIADYPAFADRIRRLTVEVSSASIQ